jgi:hypothetical protein
MVGHTDAGNFMLFAFTRIPSAERLRHRPAVLAANTGVRDMEIREVALPGTAAVFTDDLAPIEDMTRRMLAAR